MPDHSRTTSSALTAGMRQRSSAWCTQCFAWLRRNGYDRPTPRQEPKLSELEAIRLTQSLAAEAAAEAATEWLMDGHGHGREFITIADLLHRPEWHRRAACRGSASSPFSRCAGSRRTRPRPSVIAARFANRVPRGGAARSARVRHLGRHFGAPTSADGGAVGDRWRDLGISVSQGARSRLGNAAKFPIRSRCHIQEAVLPAS